ncbi:MAG: PIG-L family deacetylase [Jatrophihabitans sp.]
MTTFTHLDDGTAESAWTAAIDELPRVVLPPPGTPIVVLAAHPDDETLGAGGLIVHAVRRGHQVTVLVASDGARSHPLSPTHSEATMAQLRRSETDAAVTALGAELVWLGLADGRLSEHVADVAAALAGRCTAGGWLFAPWSGDRHPDHEACSRAAALVTDQHRWEYPIWAWHWAGPEIVDDGWLRLPIDESARRVKAAALGCYRSQTHALSEDESDQPVLTPAFLEHFGRTSETFIDPLPRAAAEISSFDDLYATGEPWRLDRSWYEQRKRDTVLAALPRPAFRRGFEPGCGPGLLTTRLAPRCGEFVAADGAQTAVSLARARTGLHIEQMLIPSEWPTGEFDLIVLHEVGYYVRDLPLLAERIQASLADDGVLVTCHWRWPAPDHPWSGDEVLWALRSELSLRVITHHEEPDFVLDVFDRTGRSVAQAEGIVG